MIIIINVFVVIITYRRPMVTRIDLINSFWRISHCMISIIPLYVHVYCISISPEDYFAYKSASSILLYALLDIWECHCTARTEYTSSFQMLSGLRITTKTGHLPMVSCHAGVYNIMHTYAHTFPCGILNVPYKEINNSRFRIIRTREDACRTGVPRTRLYIKHMYFNILNGVSQIYRRSRHKVSIILKIRWFMH